MIRRSKLYSYPVCLNVANKTCVVVGGGAVAERKARSLLEAGARVVLVGPDLTPGLRELREEGRLAHVARPYRDGDLSEAFLAIAATDDPATNQAVAAEAARRRVLANVAGAGEGGDFTLPAVLRRGDMVIGVATGRRSPATARFVRDELARWLSAEYLALLEVAAAVRAEMAARAIDVSAEAWRQALDEELMGLIRQQEIGRAGAVLTERLTRRGAWTEQSDRREG